MSIALVITDRNPEKLQRLLQAKLPDETIEVWPDIRKLEEVEYAVMWKQPSDIWQQLPALKVAQSLGAGVEHLVFDKNLPENLVVSRIVDQSLANQMAEYVLAVILMRQCRLDVFHQQQVNKHWKFQRRLQGKRVTVLGVGEIGDVVARLLQQYGFKVVGWSRTTKTDKGYPCISGHQALPERLSQTDYVINLLPDTQETFQMIDQRFLSACDSNTYLINVGRGRTVNEPDLCKALTSEQIAGATLDVFCTEPLGESSPLWQVKNLQITPHIAAITDQGEIIEQVARNFMRMKAGQSVENRVDLTRGY